MGATCRFDDEDSVRGLCAGCPLRSIPPARNEGPCARCPANAAWPGEATIGCRLIVPGAVWTRATSELLEKAPELLDAVHALRREAIDGERLTGAAAVLDRWGALADLSADGHEVVAAGRAFLRAAGTTGQGVRLWE